MSPTLTVPSPEDNPTVVACVVRGYNSGAIQDGWLVYYHDLSLPPSDALTGQLAMVMTKEGRRLLRTMKRGRKVNTWDLFTVTGPAMLDVEIEWAQPIIWIKPHYSWSADELAVIEAIG